MVHCFRVDASFLPVLHSFRWRVTFGLGYYKGCRMVTCQETGRYIHQYIKPGWVMQKYADRNTLNATLRNLRGGIRDISRGKQPILHRRINKAIEQGMEVKGLYDNIRSNRFELRWVNQAGVRRCKCFRYQELTKFLAFEMATVWRTNIDKGVVT